MITLYTSFKIFFQKRKALSDERVVSVTMIKNEYDFGVTFL